MTDEQTAPPSDPDTMPFAEFLQTVPPGQTRLVTGVGAPGFSKASKGLEFYVQLKAPPLLIHCEQCGGERTFRGEEEEIQLRDVASVFLGYECSNCRWFRKTFSLHLRMLPAPAKAAEVYKYGEMPPFGVPVPNRLLKMLGKQRANFLKGRRCENQGLGIGAFAYYRRVVESQKNEILDEMIAVSRKQGALAETIAALEEAKSEIQFSKAVSSVKLGLPDSILINTHNPLTLLHSALSAGVHEHTDERCLELAQAVRLVLVELAERLSQALKNEAELNSAVSRLLKAREASD
ncbi:hypothetical protein ABIB90_002757 [Bradyrhizobium sp. JR4.1]|uniref:hypothetical protein n=1 Tax=Bradyrhizobium sp. JR4.1 TaxID=3156372 RepID=UPI0033997B70